MWDLILWIIIDYPYDKFSSKFDIILFIETVKNSPKIFRYFDIPIQHFSNKILTLVKKYLTSLDYKLANNPKPL